MASIISIKRLFCTTVITFALSGCSILPDWLGESEDKDRIEGERISVLSVEHTIRPDPTLEGVPVMVPKPIEGKRWYKSSGYHILTYPNPSAPKVLTNRVSVDIGKGGSEHLRLNSTPIIAKEMVFTIDGFGKVSAFDAKNPKKRIWQKKVKIGKDNGSFSNGGISYYEGRIYVSSGGNQIVALSAKTGAELWRRTIQTQSRSAPAVKAGRIFVNTIDNRLYALEAASGGILWTHTGVAEEISMHGSASPIVSDNIIFSPYSSGELFALRSDNGNEIWAESYASPALNVTYAINDIDASPVINDNKIFTVSSDGVLAANNLSNGKRIWEQEISGIQTPWVVGDYVYILSNKNELVSVNIESGGVKWVNPLPNYTNEKKKKGDISWSGPVMAGNYLRMVGSHGKMFSINPVTGKVIHVNKIPKGVFLPPVVAYNRLYLLTNDAKLVVLYSKEQERSKKVETSKSHNNDKKVRVEKSSDGFKIRYPSILKKVFNVFDRDRNADQQNEK